MSDREAEGEWDKTKGKVREGVGKVTGDKEEEAHGKMDQAKGGAKKTVGSLEKDIEGKD